MFFCSWGAKGKKPRKYKCFLWRKRCPIYNIFFLWGPQNEEKIGGKKTAKKKHVSYTMHLVLQLKYAYYVTNNSSTRAQLSVNFVRLN